MTPANVVHRENELLALKSIVGTASFLPADAVAALDETGVTASDFSDSKARDLFGAVEQSVRSGETPEATTIAAKLSGTVPRALVLEVFGKQDAGGVTVTTMRLAALKQSAQRRVITAQIHGVLELARNESVPLDTITSEAQRVLSALGADGTSLRSADTDLQRLLGRLDAVQRGERETVLETGIDALDFFTALRRTLIIVASMPGVGKSALIASIVRNLVLRPIKVGVISLEDEREWLLRRILADAARVPLFVLGSRPMTTEQLAHTNEAAEALHAALQNLVMEDRPGMNTAEVVASARRMVAAGCKAIFVDHLGEIRLERTDRHDLDIMEALQSLRALAKTYQVPVVVACHLKRRQGLDVDTPPLVTDFAFSAAVERMARVALGLYRSKSGNIGCVVLKQTEGPAGFDFELNFSKLYGMVDNTPITARMRDALSWAAPWQRDVADPRPKRH